MISTTTHVCTRGESIVPAHEGSSRVHSRQVLHEGDINTLDTIGAISPLLGYLGPYLLQHRTPVNIKIN